MSIDTLSDAQQAARETLGNASRDVLTNSSPCTEWDVAALIDHLVGSQYWFLEAISAPMPGGGNTKASSGDYVAAFDVVASSVMEALSSDGFASRPVDLPFGTFTGDQFIDFVSLETLAHAWDIARATSQSTDLAPNAAEHLLVIARALMGEEGRSQSTNFGPVQPCASDAPAADRLAAYLGRHID